MKNQNKKGFTIVELVIVIAVIAILAAVLIPTFVGLVDEANKSADQQAVNQMNKALAMNDALEGTDNILDVFVALEEAGMSAKNYKPLAKDMYFFYDAELKCVLYVDKDMKVVAPAEHEGLTNTGRTWLSLTQTIETKAPADYKAGTGISVKVTSGAEMLYVLEDIQNGKAKKVTITIPEEGIDMMGASFGITELNTDLTIKGEGETSAVIKNATAVDTGKYGDGVTEGGDGQYNTSLFGTTSGKITVTIENVTFENVHVKNTHGSKVALLFAGIGGGGTVNIKDVTIKNSSVIGHRNVGALVGLLDGKVNVSNTTLENVDVKTVGGRSGMLVGYNTQKATSEITYEATTLKNCSYGIYECEQNTGTSKDGKKLGLQENGTIYSWAYDGKNNYQEHTNNEYYYVANALVMVPGENGTQVAENDLFANVTGWNK